MVDKIHVVRPGENLWKIAQFHYGQGASWPRIAAANRLKDPSVIIIGTKLRIPGTGSSIAATGQRLAPVGTRPVIAPQSGVSFPVAMGVAYPQPKYKLEKNFEAIRQTTPYGTVTIALKGEMQLSLGKPLDIANYDFQKKELSGSLKSEYDNAFAKAVGSIDYKLDLRNRKVELSTGLATSGKVGGKTFGSTKAEIVLPNKFVFTSEPEPIKGTSNGLTYEGVMSCEVEIAIRPTRATWDVFYEIMPSKEQVTVVVGLGLTATLMAAAIASSPITVPATVAGVALIAFTTVQKNPSDYGIGGQGI